MTVVIPQDTSYLSTPLVIPTRIIEEKLNRCIGRQILNDQDFDNLNFEGKKDKLKLKVTRLGDRVWRNIQKPVDIVEQWDFRLQQIWVRPADIAALVIVKALVRVELEQI